nr:hypothetical protein [uncultured Treponema sp.]
MILVIDNYDSFTFNVTQLLQTVTDKEIKNLFVTMNIQLNSLQK